jgi:DNA-binding transcriptional LysR family regulator
MWNRRISVDSIAQQLFSAGGPSRTGRTRMSTAALKDLNKLSTFVRVAERRSFTKAAEDLRTTPSVVSSRIKELEESLGFRLMNRSTHGIVLTDAGEGLFQSCLEMLAKLDACIVEARNIHAGPVGTLRVQATSDYARWVLAPLMADFAREYPGLRVYLAVIEEGQTTPEEGVDVIVASRKPAAPGLQGEPLGTVEHVICASPEYFAHHGRPQDPRDLREHHCLLNVFAGAAEWPFEAAGRRFSVTVKGTLSSNSYAALVEMARRGCGIVRVPRHAVRSELRAGSLEAVLGGAASPPEQFEVYFPKGPNVPMKITAFVSFLGRALGSKQAPDAAARPVTESGRKPPRRAAG